MPLRGPVLPTALALLAVPVLAGCTGSSEDDVRRAATAFLTAWQEGNLDEAAALTTDPDATRALLEQTAEDLPADLDDVTVPQDAVTVEEGSATVRWSPTWDVEAAPVWSYDAHLRLSDTDEGWRVVPDPSLVHPELGEGQRLVLERSLPERAAITDADGDPLFTDTEVVEVGIDPSMVTDLPSLAAGLSAATGVPAEEIVADVEAAPAGQFVPVITLRRPQFEEIRDRVFDLPGAVFPTGTRLLAPTPRFAVALLGRVGPATAELLEESAEDGEPRYAAGDVLGLSGLQRAYQEQLTGTPGFTVSVTSADDDVADEGVVVASVDPVPGEPLRTPLVPEVQLAAEQAVATRTEPAHLVAVRPGTGEILAVASNEAANPVNALSGQFPPGSSFKPVTATALLSAGALEPATPVPCPPTTTVDGRVFENEDRFDLGTVPFTRAFARSCNTTFIEQGLQLPQGALAEAAAAYGIGSAWDLPVGIFGGSVPADSTGTTRAANLIGQGEVLVSPAQMALLAAGIAGGPAAPVEVLGAEPAGPAPAGPDDAVLEQLRPMLREVVGSGTATELADRGEVHGKTGTAEYGSGDPPPAHGWFVGYRPGAGGDVANGVAFAVLVEGGQSSSAAVALTDAFLAALG